MSDLRKRSAWLVLVGMFSILPVTGFAQDATLNGTVTDSTGGVLPGVTITAVNEETGNTFVAVTDGSGEFRVAGAHRGLPAHRRAAGVCHRDADRRCRCRSASWRRMTLQMAPSTVQETVTVTGEAPLIDVTTSTATANIDQRQMQELPLNGRNWLDLTLLAPGSRANTGGETPIPRSQMAFQINMDGQQVTNSVAGAGFGQPRFSRDSIAEFEFVTNRFDATQGRSMGVIVNAVTKSGTNRHSGTISGYFRDSDWAAEGSGREPRDPVLEPAVQHHVRRTDPARPHSRLRQLRVRARAADRRLQRPVTRRSTSTCTGRGRRARRA